MKKLFFTTLILFSINVSASPVVIQGSLTTATGVDGKAACKAAHSEALNKVTNECTLAGGSSFKIVREEIDNVEDTSCNMYITIQCEIDFN